MTIPQAFQIALQHHETGRLAEAEALYRQILAVQPNHAEALHFLGVIAHQAGRHDLAVQLISQAVVLSPNNSATHCNLGVALSGIGRFDEAAAAYRRALQLRPDSAEAYNNLGNALTKRGQLDDAVAAFRRALELRPNYPEAHNNLGNALTERGQLNDAVAACRRALELKPEFAEAQSNLGNALRDQGYLDDAIAAFHNALELKPNYPEAHSNLGNALNERGQFDDAIAVCRHALQLKPDFPEAYNNLGNALRGRGQLDDAVSAFQNALKIKPDFSEAQNNLGNALRDRGELDEAIAAYRRALEIKPDCAWMYSNLVFALHLHPSHTARTISNEHQCWNRQFSDSLKQFILPRANNPAVAGRLRVGYVSPDLRDHAVGRFVLPLLERHDREQFEILCYSGTNRSDWMTERLRALGGKWRNTAGITDAALAEMIREDGVDILVDLALHTAGNRLLVFARQPAPVQVSWLGCPGSVGVDGIGYRLTDAFMDLPEAPDCSAEEAVRLPDCWCCYAPAGESPEINALPALAAGSVTFGSLNNFAKVNSGVLALWARVVEAVKGSRLLMYCPQGRARERVCEFFGARGIVTERLELVGYLPRWEYLKLYQRIDIGLDPFPFNGMTTTCDALWMGAPVLTLPGKMPASRSGLSLLSNVGLGELVASSEEDVVQRAVEMAGDLPRLAELRATLRARMQRAPLMDAPRFARNVEAAYRKMWEAWCGR